MHTRPSDVIADQIRKHRDRVGLTREQLAAECAKLGAPELTFGALTNIETGRKDPKTGMRRRDVSVEELQVIAYALGVPLLELMFPLKDQETVPVPPDWQQVQPLLAWRVAIGEEPPTRIHSDRGLYADHDRIGESGPTRLQAWQGIRGVVQWHRRLGDETREYQRAEASGDDDGRRRAIERVARTLEEMMAAGLVVPAYPLDFVEEIRKTGLITYPEALRTTEGTAG